MTAKDRLNLMSENSQNYKVLNHMICKGPITTYQAYELYGITRLSARISDITSLGIPVARKTIYDKKRGNHWNEYWIGEQ